MRAKEIIRIFMIVMSVIIAILSALLYFNGAFDDDTPSHKELTLDNGSKFPIESYIFENIKNQVNQEELFVVDEPVVEETKPTIEDMFANARANIPPPTKYTADIFPSTEDAVQKERDRQLALRLTRINSQAQINSFRPKQEAKTDFGAEAFDNYKKQDKSSNETKLYRAITADKMIPAILINAIHSTLEGKVVAQIEDDIYASLGKALLIPKGSRAIGFYSNNNQIGENRLRLSWQRIITPHGHNIILTDAQSADILGNSGVVGVVDPKYWDRYGMPLTLSTLTNSVLLLVAQQKNTNQNSQVILDSSRQDIGYIMKNIIDEQVQIRPTIEVMAGSRIFINTTQDIWFPIPKGNETIVQFFDKEQQL